MKYASIPAEKCLAQHKKSSPPVTSSVGRTHPVNCGREASAKNVRQSEFIRRAIQGASIRPVVTVSPVNDELLAALGKLTAEYGRIGSNLNQIARAVGGWHNPYPQLAAEVRAAASDLAALKFAVLEKVGEAVGNVQTYQL